MNKQKIKIIVATPFEDAGDATRGIEIAKAVRQYAPKNIQPIITFLSHGSKFEHRALNHGFKVYHTKPKLDGISVDHDLKMTLANFIGNEKLAKHLIQAEIAAYQKLKPDLILYGFWPMSGLARRMVKKEIPGICFLPLPLTDALLDTMPDVPEEIKFFSLFPKDIRQWLMHAVPKFIQRRVPPLRQPNILKAVKELGWHNDSLVDVFDMLKPDLMIVNDLPNFYPVRKFPKNIVFTGPLFSESDSNERVSTEVKQIFSKHNKRLKVFCTLGSSGTKKQLLEIIKVFTYGDGLKWDAVILSPPSVCPIKEAKKIAGGRKGIYITDMFVPAEKVNALADMVVCHGGQGTLQTALKSGTPLVGVAMQPEQFINLYNIESVYAGLHIPFKDWKSDNIQKAISKLSSSEKYKKSAQALKKTIKAIDGHKNAAKAIWQFIHTLNLP